MRSALARMMTVFSGKGRVVMENYAVSEEEISINWRKYLDIVKRYVWLLVVLPLVTGALAAGYAFSLPKIYKASTVILVEDKSLLNPLIKGLAVSSSPADKLETIREEVLSWPRLTRLVEELGLASENDGVKFVKLIEGLRRRIKINMKKNGLIIISCEDKDPFMAQKIVEKISELLINKNISSQSSEADEAIKFIEKQLEEYRKKLEESEDKLRRFKEVYTVSLPVAARVNQQIIDLEIQLNTLLIENTESHPAVIAIKKKIAQLKGERKKELLKMEEKGIDINSENFKEISYSVPRQQQELAKLQRDTKVNAALYEQLLSRLESAKISKKLDSAEEGTRFKIIEPPRLPIIPVKPNILRIIIFGFAFGLGIAGGIIFLFEASNRAFRTLEDAKKSLKQPILGAISVIDLKKINAAEIKLKERRATRHAGK